MVRYSLTDVLSMAVWHCICCGHCRVSDIVVNYSY